MGAGRVTPPAPRDALVAAGWVGVINAALWAILSVVVRISWDVEGVNTVGRELLVGLIIFTMGVLLVVVCLQTRLPLRRRHEQLVGAIILSAVLGLGRTAIDQKVIPFAEDTGSFLIWWAVAVVGNLVVASPAILVSNLVARRLRAEQARITDRERNRAATAALEAEEAAMRRQVAEHLHGTVQNRLVLVGAGLDQLAVESDDEGRPDRADALRGWARMIDTVRERDVRAISHQVFPTGLDIGLVQALGLVMDRLPPSVATAMHSGEGLREADQRIPIADRLLVAATVEEGLTNALKHGHATRVALDLEVDDHTLSVTLDDNGTGLPAGEVRESGLLRHRARLEPRGGGIELLPGAAGGTRLRMWLPID